MLLPALPSYFLQNPKGVKKGMESSTINCNLRTAVPSLNNHRHLLFIYIVDIQPMYLDSFEVSRFFLCDFGISCMVEEASVCFLDMNGFLFCFRLGMMTRTSK